MKIGEEFLDTVYQVREHYTMQNTNSSAGWTKWILAGVVVVLAAGGGSILLRKNSDATSTDSSTGTLSGTPTVSAALVTSGTIINTEPGKNNNSGVAYLADSSGHTLYMYNADTKGVGLCTDSCLKNWPLYGPGGTTAPTTLPAKVTVITRADGVMQYAYDAMPLYTFTGDTSVGQVTGDGVGGFTLMKPDM